MPEFAFVPGTFRQFKTLNRIHLGAISKDLPENTLVEFDGTTLKIGTESYSLPTFIGALRNKWAVPVNDNVSHYVPLSSGVTMHSATNQERTVESVTTTVTEDELQVGSVAATNAKRTAPANKLVVGKIVGEDDLPEVDYKLPPAKPQSSNSDEIAVVENALNNGKKVSGLKAVYQTVVEDQDAQPVARVMSPAVQGMVDARSESAVVKDLDPIYGKVSKVQHLVDPPVKAVADPDTASKKGPSKTKGPRKSK
jgi:hypothetical protein